MLCLPSIVGNLGGVCPPHPSFFPPPPWEHYQQPQVHWEVRKYYSDFYSLVGRKLVINVPVFGRKYRVNISTIKKKSCYELSVLRLHQDHTVLGLFNVGPISRGPCFPEVLFRSLAPISRIVLTVVFKSLSLTGLSTYMSSLVAEVPI